MFPDTWETFIQNCGVTTWFGARDQTTREYVSKLSGTCEVLSRSRSVSIDPRTGEPNVNDSASQFGRPLLLPQEVGQFAPDEMIAFIEGVRCGPIRARRKFYFRSACRGYRNNPYVRMTMAAFLAGCSGDLMPTVQQKPKSINARRFAALFAGFDTGNASEEEAMSKGRALRRMAADANMRIVDVLEMPEVRQALDDQMQPARGESKEMQKALEQMAALREELTARTRDVRRMAEILAKNAKRPNGPGCSRLRNLATPRIVSGRSHGCLKSARSCWRSFCCAWPQFVRDVLRRLYELGNREGTGAEMVRQSGTVFSVPEFRAVSLRLRCRSWCGGTDGLHPLSQSLLPVGGTVSDGQPNRLFALYGQR